MLALYVILYILGGMITLFFNYINTSSDFEPIDIILFILWPFAAIIAIPACILYLICYIPYYLAEKFKK